MRRALLTIGGTAAGLAALLSFKTHSPADAAASTPATTTPTSSATSPSGSTSGSATKSTKSKEPAGTQTVTGKVADTQYGPMQVQLVYSGKKITNVNVLQRTDTGVTSVQIDDNSIPKLTSEVLTAQSARIDAVSGATATSQGYVQSLQSALDMGRA